MRGKGHPTNRFELGMAILAVRNSADFYFMGCSVRVRPFIFRHSEMEDNDLWRLAATLRLKYGEEAELFARQKADEASQMHNWRSCVTWRRIALAVSDLEQRATPIHDIN
jgi:hypothetical protein